MTWKVIICIITGYSLGGINPAYIFGRIRGFDIRKRGSGNAGASNALITIGKLAGVVSALLDIFKAVVAVSVGNMIIADADIGGCISGTACILGHMFPILMRFAGGKGLACLGGVIITLDWRLGIGMLIAEAVILLLTDYICFVPVTASIAFPAVYGLVSNNIIGALILSLTAIAILYRHIRNFKRIRRGTELHFSYLWRHDEEKRRVEANINLYQNKE